MASLSFRKVAALSVFAVMVVPELSSAATAPERPRLYVDTAYVPPSGRTIAVAAGEKFQSALNAARPGDVITLEAGATFTGPFRLPNKRGSGWIIVRTSAPDSSLPPPGTRVTPPYAKVMPKLVAASGVVITTASGAHHYRFVGIEFRPKDGVALENLVQLGAGETSLADLPHHLIIDRCYLHGDPKKGTRRGVALNSRHTAVIDSYLADFKEIGADSQAIGGWNGSGPFKIVNNYLEGAGENVMFGGGDPTIPDLVPSDIEIRSNHFFKPLAWKAGEPTYDGTAWTVKNLFELKNARRVLVEGNLFEHSWEAAQRGFAILFTVRNQDGKAPWSVVEDVTFTRNVVRHTGSGIDFLGSDYNFPSQQTKRILVHQNLFEDAGGPRWGGGGRLFQLLDGTADVVIDHNTAFQTGPIIFAEGAPHRGFVYRNNLTLHAAGIAGTNTGVGLPTLAVYFPGAVVTRNVLIGGDPARYPPGNFFPASLDEVGFLDRAAGVYQLGSSSPYRKVGTDGADIGVEFDALWRMLTPTLRGPTQAPRPRAEQHTGQPAD